MKKIISLNLYKKNRLEKQYNNINCINNLNDISFIIDDVKTSLKGNIFIRENNEYKFEIDLLNHKSYYLLKDKNLKFDIQVESASIRRDNNIIIEYKIETDEDPFKLEIIESSDENE